jgi:hypothetical protein
MIDGTDFLESKERSQEMGRWLGNCAIFLKRRRIEDGKPDDGIERRIKGR